MIGIIGAMEEEVQQIRQEIHDPRVVEKASYSFISGHVGDLEVVLLQSGIGKVNAAIGTTLMIEHYSPKFILNTGSAGGLLPELSIGDVVLAESAGYHDVDATAFGYAKGQIPRMPLVYAGDSRLLEIAQRCVANGMSFSTVRGLIVSGDKFLAHPDEINNLLADFPESAAVEMESAAIAQTCYQLNTPFLIIRSISDKADSTSPGDFQENLHTASMNSARTILELLRFYREHPGEA
ncbi:5'-methylthioadenosine/adenosylhomocysteine nucleosidase [Salinispira pacifica]|nr:5'-methylthioadenosine/adenosylhomocysteine nucleosidase [Salinispira pacifica]